MSEPRIKTKHLTFNVGVRYAIALTEAVSQQLGKPCDIQESIKYYFFENQKDVKRWCEALFLSVNIQRECDNKEQMTYKEFMGIIDKMGINVLGEHFALLAKTFTELNGKSESSILEKKKNIFSRLKSYLSFRAK